MEASNKVGVRDNSEGGEVILFGLNNTKINCHIDVVPDNRMRLWAEIPATNTTPTTTYEVAPPEKASHNASKVENSIGFSFRFSRQSST